jgi:hypothetical protein
MGPIPIAQVNLPSCSLVEYSHSGLTTVYDKPFRVFQGSIVWIVWKKKGTARSPSKSVGLVSWPHRVWARTCELAGSNRCQCMPCNFDSLCTHACVAAWVWFILILCVCGCDGKLRKLQEIRACLLWLIHGQAEMPQQSFIFGFGCSSMCVAKNHAWTPSILLGEGSKK